MQPGARGLLRKWPGVPQVIPERKKSPEVVDPSCARSERANTGYGHQDVEDAAYTCCPRLVAEQLENRAVFLLESKETALCSFDPLSRYHHAIPRNSLH
jgi:hypothetical protein